jgi:hypothetical protein
MCPPQTSNGMRWCIRVVGKTQWLAPPDFRGAVEVRLSDDWCKMCKWSVNVLMRNSSNPKCLLQCNFFLPLMTKQTRYPLMGMQILHINGRRNFSRYSWPLGVGSQICSAHQVKALICILPCSSRVSLRYVLRPASNTTEYKIALQSIDNLMGVSVRNQSLEQLRASPPT